jgi:hypothetical protein
MKAAAFIHVLELVMSGAPYVDAPRGTARIGLAGRVNS